MQTEKTASRWVKARGTLSIGTETASLTFENRGNVGLGGSSSKPNKLSLSTKSQVFVLRMFHTNRQHNFVGNQSAGARGRCLHQKTKNTTVWETLLQNLRVWEAG